MTNKAISNEQSFFYQRNKILKDAKENMDKLMEEFNQVTEQIIQDGSGVNQLNLIGLKMKEATAQFVFETLMLESAYKNDRNPIFLRHQIESKDIAI